MRWSFEVYRIRHLRVKQTTCLLQREAQKFPFNKRPLGLSTMRVATGMKVLEMIISWFKLLEVLGNIAWTLALTFFFIIIFWRWGIINFTSVVWSIKK